MRSYLRKGNDGGLISLFSACLFVFIASQCRTACADPSDSLKAYNKLNWGLEDVYVTGYPPNVLLLVDTGSPMLWTPQGKMPSGKISYRDTPLEDCTYGDGSRPTSKWGSRNDRYGVDRDGDNNDIYDDNDYYNDLIFRDPRYTRENPKPNYSVDDLIPNDSRLYKMKLVLWRLMESPELIKDMNLGLATFWQQNMPNGAWADWYKGYHYKHYASYDELYQGGPDWIIKENYSTNDLYKNSQKITWGVDINNYYGGSQKANKARLRVPIQSTSDSDVVNQIKTLIDGEESWNNDELRADGKAPLARSIYSDKVGKNREDNGDISGTAWHFFDSTHMGGICQTNWLVVLTAGDDNIGGESPVDSVKNLYKKSSELRADGKILSYPIRTLVIGFVDPDDDSPDVVRLRNTLNEMAFYGMDSGYYSNGTPKEYVPPADGESYAFFANDVPGLIQGFTRVFATIQSGRFGSNAAIAIRSPGADGSLSAYVPSYVKKSEGQWWGDLRKEDLDTGKLLWSAETELPSPGARKIYTVNWDDDDGTPEQGVNNLAEFTPETYSYSAFSEETGVTGGYINELNDFIGWIRGYEKYIKGNLDRREHILGDMEHSDLCLVGPPSGSYVDSSYLSFKKKWKNRSSSVYIQSNDGMLHSFDADTGEERWAFVPPNVLNRYRIASLRFVTEKIGASDNYKITSYSSGERSIPLYLLDGPIAVGDVKLPSGAYGTILVGFLGRGGGGMYAMDVTDPKSPVFLWAVENIFDVENESGSKLYWIRKGSSSALGVDLRLINKNDDPMYNLLGFTVTGAPSLGRVYFDGGERSVFVLSGGVGLKKLSDIGRAIYVVDVLTGDILERFEGADDDGGATVALGTVLSPAVAYSTAMRDRKIEGFFSSDSNGAVLQGKFKGEVWTLNKLWTLSCPYSREGLSFSSLVNPLPLGVGLIDNDIWFFGGTSGMSLLKDDGFSNYINIIYSLNSDRIKETSGFRDFSNEDAGLIRKDDYSVSDGSLGWFMPLSRQSSELGQEYSTTAPLLSHSAIFIATYQKDLKEDLCSANGFAHLYVLDPATGRGLWDSNGKKRLTFKGLKIAGITVLGDKLLLSVKKMKSFVKPEDADNIGIVEKGDLVEIDLKTLNLKDQYVGSRKPRSIYWREIFSQ